MFGVNSENKDTIFSGITFYVLCFTKTENRKPKTENRKPKTVFLRHKKTGDSAPAL
jgi:hypothetical protein